MTMNSFNFLTVDCLLMSFSYRTKYTCKLMLVDVAAIAQIRPNTPGGAVQNLRIMLMADGEYHVEGLLPGQQLIRLPDGKFQVITPKRAPSVNPQPVAQPAPVPVAVPPPATAPAATNQLIRVQAPAAGGNVQTLVSPPAAVSATGGAQIAAATPQPVQVSRYRYTAKYTSTPT